MLPFKNIFSNCATFCKLHSADGLGTMNLLAALRRIHAKEHAITSLVVSATFSSDSPKTLCMCYCMICFIHVFK